MTDGAGRPSGAYVEHAHGTLGPVFLAAAVLAMTMALAVISAAVARHRTGADVLDVMSEHLARLRPVVAIPSVAVGGLTVLTLMEFVEQLQGLGRITGVGDALGGNPVPGLAVVVAVAAAIALASIRCARFAGAVTVTLTAVVCEWISRLPISGGRAVAAKAQGPRVDCSAAATSHLARCAGLRAPPALPATNISP